MKKMNRQEFIKLASQATLALGLGFPMIGRSDHIGGHVWGDVPSTIWPNGSPDINVLEIHLLGGVAPFESFYYRPDGGLRTRGFDTEVTNLAWNSACPGIPSGLESLPFANDSNGKMVDLGPFAKPLWPSHISDRMRTIVLAHNLLPHQAAIPFTLTGLRLGQPNQASLGAPIQRRFNRLDEEANAPQRAFPYSYGLLPQTAGLNALLSRMMGAYGRQGGASRPLVLKIGSQFSQFISQLERTNISDVTAVNDLLDQYRAHYRDWLRWQGNADPADLTRSRAFQDYDSAVSTLFDSPALSTLLTTAPTTIDTEAQCARNPAEVGFSTAQNFTKTALRVARYLLKRPAAERARYVCVVDRGIEQSRSLPYDVHNAGHVGDTGSNLWNVFQTLADMIVDPANPTPEDANKLDLDETLIIINTDFGRTPFKSMGDIPDLTSLGRDHWPEAYVNVLIGGPITQKAVVGSISDAAETLAIADIPYSPTDVRSAALLAAGINPFENESFALGQLTSSLAGISHEEGMENLRTEILGVS